MADFDRLSSGRNDKQVSPGGGAGRTTAVGSAAGRTGSQTGGGSQALGGSSTGVPHVGGTTINGGAGVAAAGFETAGIGSTALAGAGSTAAGGVSSPAGSGNIAGAAGIAGSGTVVPAAPQCEGDPKVVGPAARPQLTAAAAEEFTVRKYLARAGKLGDLVEDGWDPTGGIGDVTSFVPTFTVAADGTGTHTTIQAALAAAAASPGEARALIRVKPGTYREAVCISGPRPVTVYGESSDATQVLVVFNNNAGSTKVNPCAPTDGSVANRGMFASATFGVSTNDVQLKNLTIANDFTEGTDPWAYGQQAVTLLTQGDRIVLENMRLLGNHLTTAFRTPDAATVARVFVTGSYISGDMQFITGRATVVIDNTEIGSRTTRITKPFGSIIAAGTAGQNPYGFLIVRSRFTVDLTTDADWVLMGRSWDEDTVTYVEGTSPNGQVVIRETNLARHINKVLPWGNALETARVFDCHGSRLFEYANTGPGSLQ